jgi:hypothetical protein
LVQDSLAYSVYDYIQNLASAKSDPDNQNTTIQIIGSLLGEGKMSPTTEYPKEPTISANARAYSDIHLN